MTSDEAISIMNVIVHMLEPQYDTDRIEDAVEMAIKALDQEPCDDAVSRQAVYEILNDAYFLKLDDGAALQESVKQLPSVTPQQKPNIKALGEDIRICQKSITDKKVLIGFNMAVALCNKHLAESEVQDADRD